MERLTRYFPGIYQETIDQLERFRDLFLEWNQRVNLISRKDSENLTERHILHSLSIALYYPFIPGTRVIDIGTGGGFPGIPLAIYFPEVQFTLVDSVSKKIRALREITGLLKLKNVKPLAARAETLDETFDFITSRAVMAFPRFVKLFHHLLAPGEKSGTAHGILYLKGGDLEKELGSFYPAARIHDLNEKLEENWFRTKKLIYLPYHSFI
ncbi:MAG TPA: 16S rRNA (guanine(527)-N(7))-methyltransferase RsmG [Bacteroidetes bacterium]|mgnify:CR=1 FL=1|nr:16S rRNA (guanine(527)-N(7))-methyltransferase RsmG [Bacteroidota bacterium]